MNHLSDQEIQAMVDAMRQAGNTPQNEDESFQTYEQLFDELTAEPPLDLSYGFSRKVIHQIQQQETARYQTKAYVVFGLTLAFILSLAFGFQAVRSANDFAATWEALAHIKWPVLFIVVLVGLIQWADYRFVKLKQAK